MARGLKFDAKYGVGQRQIYQCDPAKLVIPPPGHPLHDRDGHAAFVPRIVEEIDRDGEFAGTVTVWSDADESKLYVIDGRGTVLNVSEVNRRRVERGDEEIPINFFRFAGDLDRAVEHVRLRNFHRKRPTPSHIAREALELRRLGKTPGRICDILDVTPMPVDTERWFKTQIPLAWCVKEVADAIDAGKIPRGTARRFGGSKTDGSLRLGDEEQRRLLTAMLTGEEDGAREKPGRKAQTPRAIRLEVASRLANGHATHLGVDDLKIARAIAAAIRRLDGGERKALAYLPAIDAIFNAAEKEMEASADPAAETP